MTKSKLYKGLALANFVILIIVFLCYRNGAFDSDTQETKNDHSINQNTAPTSVTIQDTVTNQDTAMIQKPIIEEVPTITETNNNADLRFSSSKVILLPRQQTEVKEPEVVQEESIPHKEFTEEQVRMYSSKSATIVEPFLIDSAFKAFLEQEKKSKNKKKK